MHSTFINLFPSYIIGLTTGFVFLYIFCDLHSLKQTIRRSRSISLFIFTLFSLLTFTATVYWFLSGYFLHSSYIQTNSVFSLLMFVASVILSLYLFGVLKIRRIEFSALNEMKSSTLYVQLFFRIFLSRSFLGLTIYAMWLTLFFNQSSQAVFVYFIGIYTSFLTFNFTKINLNKSL